ncbi:N-terminal phage integrase SAM-like domain-containing protein [Pectinatus frisingensis]|uniref:N-terminal phage integrase SAM-like domain-containing protein n=1 Tax=Pectinatus frisingensis TaxID=865 RepID=UPI0018C4E623|nr:N-terminal phage integrase SAM-like domain-containing protein [Pectinatus frisingensis]
MARRAWGEGSYDYNEELARWRWRGYYQNNSGEKKRKEIVSKSRKELKGKVKLFLQELENNHVDILSAMTVKKWCQTWLEDVIKPSVKIKTYENYKRTCNNHIIPVFGETRLKKLQPIDIQKYLNQLCKKYATNTVITIRNHFIILLNTAIEYWYIKVNTAKRTKPPKKRAKEIMPLTDDEIKKLLYIAKDGEYIFMVLNKNGKKMRG